MTAVLDQAADIEKLLLENGVTVFGYERVERFAIVRFRMHDRKLRLVVGMPDWEDRRYTTTDQGRARAITVRRQMYWADVKRTWAAMRNLIGAKLAAINAGITDFETEFRQFEDAEALLGAGTAA